MTNGILPSYAGSAYGVMPDRSAVKTGAEDPLANKQTFLQLLVAQIKNQNPLDPADGVEFLSQLAQFTDLEQTMSMGADIAKIREYVEKTGDAAAETQE